ncbi:hypothetical protein J6590_053703 [Homalodisca vitripennis]|nr:hypothetical protein J6590_053703 [Homalodisca vitripennis]
MSIINQKSCIPTDTKVLGQTIKLLSQSRSCHSIEMAVKLINAYYVKKDQINHGILNERVDYSTERLVHYGVWIGTGSGSCSSCTMIMSHLIPYHLNKNNRDLGAVRLDIVRRSTYLSLRISSKQAMVGTKRLEENPTLSLNPLLRIHHYCPLQQGEQSTAQGDKIDNL